MDIFVLGTSGAIPTLKRNLPSVVLRRDGRLFMFDCGEGAQMQVIRSGLSLAKFEKIFITHMHGDHVTGLPGLLMLLTQAGRQAPLTIFGPVGIEDFIVSIRRSLNFYTEYEIVIKEIEREGIIYEEKEFWIETAKVDHKMFTLAFALIEKPRVGKFFIEKALELGLKPGVIFKKLQEGESVLLEDGRCIDPEQVVGPPRRGRKFVYATDTRPSRHVVKLAQDADLLIHDGMFADSEVEDAIAKGHSTARQAAEVAKLANVRQLLLTHISSRYAHTLELTAGPKSFF